MIWWIAAFIFAVLTCAFGLKLYIYGNDDYWPKHGVPWVSGADKGAFFDIVLFRIPFHELDERIYDKLKSVKDIKFGGIMEFRKPVVFLIDLELIRNVLVKDFDHFTNRRTFGNEEDFFRKTLFSMDNPPWKDMRAAMSPTFTTRKIKRMFEIFNESADKLINFMNVELSKSNQIELRDICGRYTMDVIASAAFGLDSQNFKDKNSIFSQMGHRIQNQFSGLKIFKVFTILLLPKIAKILRLEVLDQISVNFFTETVHSAIKHRERTGEKRNDFLQLLMETRSGELDANDEVVEAKDENIKKIRVPESKTTPKIMFTDEMIVAQCVLFFLAGFDTTETLLIYAAYELALQPEIQERLANEIKEEIEKDGGKLTYEAVNRLDYLEMIISETLRKYPPVPRLERKCVKDYKVPGSDYVIKKDSLVAIPVRPIHYDPEIYPDPEKFIPERFTKENKAARHPYSYMPFGLGPRNCIAMRFALTEGKAAIAHLIHNFELAPCSKTTIPIKYMHGSLKPIDGMWLTVTPRK